MSDFFEPEIPSAPPPIIPVEVQPISTAKGDEPSVSTGLSSIDSDQQVSDLRKVIIGIIIPNLPQLTPPEVSQQLFSITLPKVPDFIRQIIEDMQEHIEELIELITSYAWEETENKAISDMNDSWSEQIAKEGEIKKEASKQKQKELDIERREHVRSDQLKSEIKSESVQDNLEKKQILSTGFSKTEDHRDELSQIGALMLQPLMNLAAINAVAGMEATKADPELARNQANQILATNAHIMIVNPTFTEKLQANIVERNPTATENQVNTSASIVKMTTLLATLMEIQSAHISKDMDINQIIHQLRSGVTDKGEISVLRDDFEQEFKTLTDLVGEDEAQTIMSEVASNYARYGGYEHLAVKVAAWLNFASPPDTPQQRA